MRRDFVLFDLDGTLTDPREGITKSAAHALAYFGIHADPEMLTFFIGPPLTETFGERYGFSEEQITVAVAKFREYFEPRGWLENAPYPGIGKTLERLQSAGLKLILATSKPEKFAKRIMERFELAKYFTLLCGAPMDEKKAGKAAVVERAVREAGITDVSRAVMVGDKRHDVEGARANGIDTAGVLWGYGTREELETAGAKYIAGNLAELEKLLLLSR